MQTLRWPAEQPFGRRAHVDLPVRWSDFFGIDHSRELFDERAIAPRHRLEVGKTRQHLTEVADGRAQKRTPPDLDRSSHHLDEPDLVVSEPVQEHEARRRLLQRLLHAGDDVRPRQDVQPIDPEGPERCPRPTVEACCCLVGIDDATVLRVDQELRLVGITEPGHSITGRLRFTRPVLLPRREGRLVSIALYPPGLTPFHPVPLFQRGHAQCSVIGKRAKNLKGRCLLTAFSNDDSLTQHGNVRGTHRARQPTGMVTAPPRQPVARPPEVDLNNDRPSTNRLT